MRAEFAELAPEIVLALHAARAHGEARDKLVASWPRLDAAERHALLLEVVREIVVTDDEVRVSLS